MSIDSLIVCGRAALVKAVKQNSPFLQSVLVKFDQFCAFPPRTLRPISTLETLSMASQIDILRSTYSSFIGIRMMITTKRPEKPSHGLANKRRLCPLSDSITTAFDTSRFPFFHVGALPLKQTSRIPQCTLKNSWQEKS